jgi:mevalonate kinase
LTKSVTVSAPGKIILTGEHFVVHGSYAVAAAINKRVRVTVSESKENHSSIVSSGLSSKLDSNDEKFPATKAVIRQVQKELGHLSEPLEVRIESEIPAGSGLGSSAAVSIACTAALTRFVGSTIDPQFVSRIAMMGEKKVHGNPSGIDVEASLRGGVIMFSRKDGVKTIQTKDAIQLIVIYSGKKRSTSRLIAEVARRKRSYPNFFQLLADSASYQSREVVDALKDGDLQRLGWLFNIAQTELDWIGVSTPFIDKLIERISIGSFGAKITGAGGGGSIIVAAKPDAISTIINSISEEYPQTFITSIPQEGLRWE